MKKEKNRFYLYALLDSRKPGKYCYSELDICFLYEPFYIGKGSGNRINNHLFKSRIDKNTNKRKVNKIKKIIDGNQKPIAIKIKENLSNKIALSEEMSFIKIIGRLNLNKGPLTNFTDGGDSPGGFNHSEETKNKISKSCIGRKPWNKGGSHSNESIEKMRKVKTGKKLSEDTKEKIREARLGSKHSEESIEKMRKARTGKRFTKEVKDKMSQTRKGKNIKIFKATNPNGEIFYTDNGLSEFCKSNNLSQSNMSNVANGRAKQHKGWKCEYVNKNLER